MSLVNSSRSINMKHEASLNFSFYVYKFAFNARGLTMYLHERRGLPSFVLHRFIPSIIPVDFEF